MASGPSANTTSLLAEAPHRARQESAPHENADTSGRPDEPARDAPRISVIIPARNEAATIERILRRVYDDRPWEVIVVDGESTDDTVDIATRLGATVIQTEPGRGRQLKTGAEAATGDILLFLHADTSLPRSYGEKAVRTLSVPKTVAGAFKLYIDSPGRSLRFIERAVQFRSRYLQMPYGDQALFMRTEDYHRAGGYPDWPVMEDHCLVRRLRRLGRIRIVPSGVVTSGRRWERNGVWRTTMQNKLTLLAFRLGVSPHRLARWRNGR